ncbi:MAG TPA: glutathione S-transferase, partial [Planktothrix sp. UBA8407]|nr:glutathione S-transferase [Planktothrix sp. UBA8407]
MGQLTLVIANKNYSSWSLRPWLLLKQAGINFSEIVIFLDTPNTYKQIRRYSPSGKVPVLLD